MLLFNSTFFEDRRLCHPLCDPSAIAVLHAACQGLCDSPRDMRNLHAQPPCTDAYAPDGEGALALPAGVAGAAAAAGAAGARRGASAAAAGAAAAAAAGAQQHPDAHMQMHTEVDGGGSWQSEVLWKLPAAPWDKHEIFAMMQDVINAPGGDW